MGEMEKKRNPVTPYTGAVENSSLGLFMSRVIKKDEGITALVVISVNDTDAIKELRAKVKEYPEDERKDLVELRWGFSIAKSKDKSKVEGVAAHFEILDKKDDRQIIVSEAMIPIKVAYNWLKTLSEESPTTTIVAFRPFSPRSRRGLNTSNLETRYLFPFVNSAENFDTAKKLSSELEESSSGWDDKLYGDDLKYPDDVCFFLAGTKGEEK